MIRSVVSLVAAIVLVPSLCGVRAQEEAGGVPASASDRDPADVAELQLRLAEAETALSAAFARAAEIEHRLASSEQRNLALGESLAAANAEARQFREEYADLRLRMEALGIEVASKGAPGLESRLLAAVNDLRLSDERADHLAAHLVELSEAVMRLLATPENADPEARAAVEAALQRADAGLRPPAGESPLERQARRLDAAKVVSIKGDLGLLVLDSGEDSGLRAGMPIRIYRNDRPVAAGVVVDVRSSISGAILTERISESEEIAVGDIARLDVNPPSLTN